MIHVREMKHNQWYMGTHHKTAVAQWDETRNCFIYGAPQEAEKQGHPLLNPQQSLPPTYEFAPHPMMAPAEEMGTAFTPVAVISGPRGAWTPKQSIDLSNNIQALRAIRNS
jgi:hypothetical protein